MLNVGNKRQNNLINKDINPSLLSLYNEPPSIEISIDEFEEFAIDRLHVLKVIEINVSRNIYGKELEMKLDKITNIYLPSHVAIDKLKKDKEKDQLSHYILRLAFCQNEELRRWFITQETALFKYRLEKSSKEEKIILMKKNGWNYNIASSEEIEERYDKLIATRESSGYDTKEKIKMGTSLYFKVPFTEAADLIRNRSVYLEKGISYIPFDQLVSLLAGRFRSHLSLELVQVYKKLNYISLDDNNKNIRSDPRLTPILTNLTNQYRMRHDNFDMNNNNNRTLTLQMLENKTFVEKNTPLCMRSLINALNENSHLKYNGRIQLNLFIKGAGLSLENAIEYWKKKFCNKMTINDFNKKYLYNIRHNYGKEGKKKSYNPLNCVAIIQSEPPKYGEYHGCPFRHLDEENLRKKLKNINGYEAIIDLAVRKNYQVACKKHWELTHPGGNSDNVGNHPNAYLQESLNFYNENDNMIETK